jgi:hypothetical protein
MVRRVRLFAVLSLGIGLIYVLSNMIPQYAQISVVNNIAFAGGNNGKFDAADFMIRNFGIGDDGNPFLTVEGKAGGSKPGKENIGYAYVFVTDNGTYAVSSDWMYTKWHTHGITLDDKNCVTSMDMNVGRPDVSNAVKVTNTNAAKVYKVMTDEFTINKNDGSICATKIFDSAP